VEDNSKEIFDLEMAIHRIANNRGNHGYHIDPCKRLVEIAPGRANAIAQGIADLRVSQLCDAYHLPIQPDEYRATRDFADWCEYTIKWLVRAGAEQPVERPCSIHGRSI
jgi:hypothetical protein